ncbi:MAG: hypothetical protein JKY56_02260 [Kofleriaceae bacterium]|nr:hypothetical protein [Kofleriaceae bacterium]
MTLVAFRAKAGLGGNVSEGDKIRTVQLRLTDCHAPDRTDEQQTAAKEALRDAIGAWRKSHTPTKSLIKKGRNKGKRRAMDELQWQIEATLINTDLDIIDRAHFRELAAAASMRKPQYMPRSESFPCSTQIGESWCTDCPCARTIPK